MFFTELFVLLTAFSVSPTRADFSLNDLELSILKSALLAGTSSVLNYHKLSYVSQYLSLYSIKLYKGIAM